MKKMNSQQSTSVDVDVDDSIFNPCAPTSSSIDLNNSQQIKKWYREPSHRQVNYTLHHLTLIYLSNP